ncbi:MAG: alkaline phosphatase family protein [Cytophagaceae bacterium]|nr:alkaline phosphatase family protein [Gemmatimonadaceae bacterium]
MALKTIVIGFDGLSPQIAEGMMTAGALPTFARLRELGGYARIATTAPAQTPVAWSTFATGRNPGAHGIFDFLRRDPRRYQPDLALSRFEQRSRLLPPKAINLRSGATIWERLGEQEIPSVVLRCPCTFPPEPFSGRLLAGMGVPDLRGGIGTATFYSTVAESAGESETLQRLVPQGRGFRATLAGPRRNATADLTTPLSVEPQPGGAYVEIGEGASSVRTALVIGQWSDWLRVRFRIGPLMAVHGLVRLLLVRRDPAIELYASPVNFDPKAPPFPISHPWTYAESLERDIGTYSTLGMPEDHTGLSNGRFDEDAFLASCDLVMREREAMLRHELSRLEHGLLFCLFDTPDRIQHMFWRFREPDHPANARHALDARYRLVIEDHYRRCDDIVGEVLRAVDDETTLMVLSDHGFTSFRRAINLNAWLADTGWLALRADASRDASGADFFHQVDWSRTRAYALGFGGIYLNVAGREGQGIVAPDDRAETASRLAAALTGLPDAEAGAVAIIGADTRERLYAGPREDEAPDVVVRCADGYRVSWGTALGAVPPGWFEDNTRKWAGDHIVDPAIVPGILFTNRSLTESAPHLLDCAPTIAATLGAENHADFEGRSFVQQMRRPPRNASSC